MIALGDLVIDLLHLFRGRGFHHAEQIEVGAVLFPGGGQHLVDAFEQVLVLDLLVQKLLDRQFRFLGFGRRLGGLGLGRRALCRGACRRGFAFARPGLSLLGRLIVEVGRRGGSPHPLRAARSTGGNTAPAAAGAPCLLSGASFAAGWPRRTRSPSLAASAAPAARTRSA